MNPSRRSLLTGAAALAMFAASRARAFGDSAKFIPAMAQHAGSWDSRSTGLRRMAWELQRRTSVETVLDARPVKLDSPQLFELPFLYLGNDGPLPPLSSAEVENLRRYLTFGGFLLADANDASDGAGFDASFRKELSRILPSAPLQDIPGQHVIFKSFYLLDAAPGRVLNRPQLQGAFVGKRAAVIYTQNDLAGAWNRDEGGSYEFECTPGGEPQRELAFRLGVNLVMYALCLDYKDDAVHLDAIMKKRR
ncbi:MAG: DUF4159 domain-containing protein [Myxococcaceae bacterium]